MEGHLGRRIASTVRMGAQTYRELFVFQHAAKLRRRVLALLATPKARADFKFRDQLKDAVRSPPRNIGEGFGRYNPAEFAQFLDIAIASLDETDNHLRDGAEDLIFDPLPAAEAIRRARNADRCRFACAHT
jgi:four helix bundle protein